LTADPSAPIPRPSGGGIARRAVFVWAPPAPVEPGPHERHRTTRASLADGPVGRDPVDDQSNGPAQTFTEQP